MKAIVLCGGLGTRLGALTQQTPKPMLEVAGSPFLGHVLDSLVVEEISGIVLAVGFQWQTIQAFVGNQWRGLPVEYSVEATALGTGGAILNGMDHLQLEEALIVNGDTLFAIDLRKFLQESKVHAVGTCMALRAVNDCSRYGRVTVNGTGRVTSFGEKGHEGSGLINGGIYCQKRAPLKQVNMAVFSFESDYLATHHGNEPMVGLRFDSYFIDIGVPEDLARAQVELRPV